ncbi:MAG: hypothetical protein U0P46_08650 [Holophagaceae bacterium]
MKLKIIILILLSICLNISCKKEEINKKSSNDLKLSNDYQLLVDFTTEEGNPPYHLSKTELKDLTDKVKLVTRKKGVITIRSSAIGSFSSSNKKEVVHIVFQEDPQASHAEGWGRTYFAIVDEKSIKLLNVGECNADNIFKTVRMPNGVDVLLMTSEFSGQGNTIIGAGLVDLSTSTYEKNNEAVLIQNFNTIYNDTCAAGDDGKTIASKVYFKFIENKFVFKKEHFVKKCGDASKFVFVETSDKSDEDIEIKDSQQKK